MSGSQKLAQLLELANQGPALRAALAEEVCELLIAWPEAYSAQMRALCEALLFKLACEIDEATRTRLRARLSFDAKLLAKIFPRQPSSRQLVQAARSQEGLCAMLAKRLELDHDTTRKILDEESGRALAVACKAADIERAAFSAIALLTRANHNEAPAMAMLDAFDAIEACEAVQMLKDWRAEPALAGRGFIKALAAAE